MARRRAHTHHPRRELEAKGYQWTWKMLRRKTFRKWITSKLITYRKHIIIRNRRALLEIESLTCTYGTTNPNHAKSLQITTRFKSLTWANLTLTILLSIRVKISMRTFLSSYPKFKITNLRKIPLNPILARLTQDSGQVLQPKTVLQLKELQSASRTAISIHLLTTMHR